MLYGKDHHFISNVSRTIVNLANDIGANSIAGPTNSGSVLASCCMMKSIEMGTKKSSIFLNKAGHKRIRHINSPKLLGDYCKYYGEILLVDDCIKSGDSIIHCIREIFNEFHRYPIACIVGHFNQCGIKNIQNEITLPIYTYNYNIYKKITI